MNKRMPLIIAAAAAFLAAACHVTAGPPRPRENINAFSQDPDKLQKLRDAVAALQARGLDQSTSWFTMAGIHDILPNDPDYQRVPTAIRSLFHQCHTREDLFFLWHRAYVAAMERLMQDAINDPDFRLPYWDWYLDPSLPKAFRDEFLDPQRTRRNPLYRENRNRPGPDSPVDVNAGDPVWTPVITTDYTTRNFGSFQRTLNENEHGDIHVFVGAEDNMGDTHFAARDPIFWLHHANIDRLLMVWLKKDPATHKPPSTFSGWVSSVYRFPISPGSTGNTPPPVRTPTIEEVALGSMEAMGYIYDNMDLPSAPAPSVPAAPQHMQASAVPSSGPEAARDIKRFAVVKPVEKALEFSAGATVDLIIQPAAREKIITLSRIMPENEETEQLAIVFSDVQVKKRVPGVASYRVFINLPKEGAGPETFRNHFVGSISLFRLQHGGEHGHSTIKLPISPVTGAPALQKSLAERSDRPLKVSVSLVPVLAPRAAAPKSPVLSIGEIRLESSKP